MAEAPTFTNFEVGVDSVYEIGVVPGGQFSRSGVVEEIKTAFGYEGDNLGDLIGQVAPNKDLQANIAFARETLSDPDVKESIGYLDKTAIEIARAWGERSGLQEKVYRPLMEPAAYNPGYYAAAVVPDRVVNWMDRMATILEEVGKRADIPMVVLVSGGREIGDGEHPDVKGGTPSIEYMSEILEPRLKAVGSFAAVETIGIEQEAGQSVIERAASYLAEKGFDASVHRLLVPAVAGNWMQTGAQARQGFKVLREDFDEDHENLPYSRQLWVASDSFPLGETGEEPKSTHQNPFSAIGNILRGAKLLDEIGR